MSSKTNGKEDEDCLFLENVLDKLYDFGDGHAPSKKLRPQKKKKRKSCDEVVPTVGDAGDCRACHSTEAGQKRQQPKIELTSPTIEPVNQVEVVTFQDPAKKPRTKQTPAPDNINAVQIMEKKQSDKLEELYLEKARLEVHQFGITGYKKEEQRVFEQDRAVMLGARPPKKSYVNYKVLQEQIKGKKQKAKEEVQPDLKKKKRKNTERDKKKVSSGSGSAPLGQLGRFKNGVLVLSSKEIQKVKGSRRAK